MIKNLCPVLLKYVVIADSRFDKMYIIENALHLITFGKLISSNIDLVIHMLQQHVVTQIHQFIFAVWVNTLWWRPLEKDDCVDTMNMLILMTFDINDYIEEQFGFQDTTVCFDSYYNLVNIFREYVNAEMLVEMFG
mgnify:CR=1 FL=1